MIESSRRGFITGLISLVAAPAIVRAGSLMPVKNMSAIAEWRYVVRVATIDITEVYGFSPAMEAMQMVRDLEEMHARINRAFFLGPLSVERSAEAVPSEQQ